MNRETRTDNSGSCANMVELLHTFPADQRSFTKVQVALVFEYNTMLMFCFKHHNKYLINPVRIFFLPIANLFFLLCNFEYNNFLDHEENYGESILTSRVYKQVYTSQRFSFGASHLDQLGSNPT